MTRIYVSDHGSESNDGLTKWHAHLPLEKSKEACRWPFGD